jgi:hypothetical protein
VRNIYKMSLSISELKNLIADGAEDGAGTGGIEVTSEDVGPYSQMDSEVPPALYPERRTVTDPGKVAELKECLIKQIELFEQMQPRRTKFPSSLRYKYGDDLRMYSVEELQKISSCQSNLSNVNKMSRIGTIMFLGLAQASEGYIDGLKGFSDNLSGSMSEIQECISEILLEQSEYIEELTSPYARLGLVVGMAGLTTYTNNMRSGTVMADQSVNNVSSTTGVEQNVKNEQSVDNVSSTTPVVPRVIKQSDISPCSSTGLVMPAAKKKAYTRTKPYRRNGKIFCHLTGKVIGTY